MKLKRTTEEEINKLTDFFNELTEYYKNHREDDLDDVCWDDYNIISEFNHKNHEYFLYDILKYLAYSKYDKILFNCSTLLDNCADKNLDYLEFNPDIKKGLELLEKSKQDEKL